MKERFRFRGKNIFIISVLNIFALTSCTRLYWTKENFNLQEWNVDNAKCQTEAAQSFPPQFITVQTPLFTTPVETKCYNLGSIVNCTTTGGQTIPFTETKDLNKSNRDNAWDRCLRVRGYYTSKKNPKPVVKSNPIKEAFIETQVALDKLCQRPDFFSFFKKSPCKSEDLTREQLSDSSKANSSEKIIIKNYQIESNKIIHKLVASLSHYGNVKVLALNELIKKNIVYSDDLFLKLLDGKCTFGDFNKEQEIQSLQFKRELKDLTSH